jgi:1-aminocyclopropane-1-carboxylate synthase
MLEDEEWCSLFLKLTRQRLSENYHLATKILNEAGIEYHTRRSVISVQSLYCVVLIPSSNAGYSSWVNLSPYLPQAIDRAVWEQALAKQFIDAGVYLGTGEEYHSEHAGWFRIVYTRKKKELVEGLKR